MCWLGRGTFSKTIFLPKGTQAFQMKNTREAGPFLASSPSSLFWGKLPTAVWCNLIDCPLSTGVLSVGGPVRGDEEFHLYPGVCAGLKATVNRSRKPQNPSKQGILAGPCTGRSLGHRTKLALPTVTTTEKTVRQGLS